MHRAAGGGPPLAFTRAGMKMTLSGFWAEQNQASPKVPCHGPCQAPFKTTGAGVGIVSDHVTPIKYTKTH